MTIPELEKQIKEIRKSTSNSDFTLSMSDDDLWKLHIRVSKTKFKGELHEVLQDYINDIRSLRNKSKQTVPIPHNAKPYYYLKP
jgi:hypothetical protein